MSSPHAAFAVSEKLQDDLKSEAAEYGISFNQYCVSLILVGRRAQDTKQRNYERILREIQKLVKEEYKRQNQAAYINSDRERPLNRYELDKRRLEEPADRKSTPLSADYDDGFSRIYDGVEKHEELE